MIKNVLTHLDGIEGFGLVSIGLFFLFFLGMLLWALRLDRRHLDAMGRLPLDDGRSGPAPRRSHPQTDRDHE